MKILSNIRFYLVVCLLTILWFFVMYSNQKLEIKEQQMKIEELTNQVDSLNGEVFNESDRAGRYEMGLEYLKEIDSSSYKMVNEYIGNETE